MLLCFNEAQKRLVTHQGPLTHGPFTCQPPYHVAPLTGIRVDPRGLLPPAPRVGHAQPCHVASMPRRIRVGPARHVNSAGSVE